MSTIESRVLIHSDLATVYAALTTQAGVRGWWNTRAQIHPEVGGESSYQFNKGGSEIAMRFRNAVLDPAGRVVWQCTDNDNQSWLGTTVRWALRKVAEGIEVRLLHEGFDEAFADSEGFRMITGGWQHFATSLKSYVEGHAGQPFD